MTHPFMAAIADGLAERGIATLRYQFPYMEQGSKRPDSPKVAHAAVRAAVLEASKLKLPLFAGGKSFGSRMTSQAQAAVAVAWSARPRVSWISASSRRKPSDERAKHLFDVNVPMLFPPGNARRIR
jgi:predicted alpha/beta-hydrolase family hydrolase